MNTVAVVGVGLIGASFGLALREAGFEGEIIGVSSEPALRAGLKSGAISSSASLEHAAARSDLIYLAQPIERILATIEKLAPLISPHCLVTDAGSTKTLIVQKARELLPPGSFLGGHPMTGKEQRGAHAADPNLFRGRIYVLTPDSRKSRIVEQEFRAWLEKIRCNLIEMTPEEHDTVVAYTSHLPQLLSTALAATLQRQNDDRMRVVFGAGLLDMTRLALSSSDIWASIFRTNKARIEAALVDLMQTLAILKGNLQTGDPVDLFAPAANFATVIRSTPSE